jgi:XrtJ-associated TM-motif-TM protein
MKNSKYIILATLLLSATLSLHAQGGCVESPEDPTAVLALLGSAAASAVYLRDRFKTRINARRK